MKKAKLIFISLALLLVLGMGYFGYNSYTKNSMANKAKFAQVFTTKLKNRAEQISNFLDTQAKQIEQAINKINSTNYQQVISFKTNNPYVNNLLIINSNGKIIYPNTNLSQSKDIDFVKRITPHIQKFITPPASEKQTKPITNYHWQQLFWNNGLELFFITKTKNNYAIISVNRGYLMHRILNAANIKITNNNAVVLYNANNQPIQSWGNLDKYPQLARVQLNEPLGSWYLSYHSNIAKTDTISFTILLGLFLLSFFGLIYYLYHEHTKALRDASQKTSFVNQVSHELKTPLTNIRLYTELLQNESTSNNKYLDIISDESKRLARLIENVLVMARKQNNKQIRLNKTKLDLAKITAECIDNFKPAFDAKNITVNANLQPYVINADKDSISQIIYNLLSNVEKYASNGKQVDITITDNSLIIQDYGPGIKKDEQDKIFDAYYRVSNKLTDGVSGTGIGLTISSELAKLNGGKLSLLPSKQGTKFELQI